MQLMWRFSYVGTKNETGNSPNRPVILRFQSKADLKCFNVGRGRYGWCGTVSKKSKEIKPDENWGWCRRGCHKKKSVD